MKIANSSDVWADPKGRAGSPPPPPPEKNHKNLGFQSNIDSDPLKKSQSFQASIQCWAIIGTPAKRHFIKMAFHWWANDGPHIVVCGSSLHSLTKENVVNADVSHG